MNILITGSGGQLGQDIITSAKKLPKEYKIFHTDIASLDITCKEDISMFCNENKIDLIINCAAYTNVDKAEVEESDIANNINNLAVKYLGEVSNENNIFLIHISTDYVFGALNNTPLKENDSINPLGVYGITKRKGEEELINSGCKYIIIRTSWLYSWHSKNFVRTMFNLTLTKDKIEVVFDQVGSPTYAEDLASFIIFIISNNLLEKNVGIYHFSNEGVCSWFDFAWEINRLAKHNCMVQPCHSDQYPSPVKRPSYSVLDKSKLKDTFGFNVPYWKVSLESCIKHIIKNEKV